MLGSSTEQDAIPSCLIRRGALSQRRANPLPSQRKNVILAFPRSTADIGAMYRVIEREDEEQGIGKTPEFVPSSTRAVHVMGQLAFAATEEKPLLIVGHSNRQFIHFSQVTGIKGEAELRSPCSFQLSTATGGDLRFRCDTSVDYLKWFNAIKYAFEASQDNSESTLKARESIDLLDQQGEPFSKRAEPKEQQIKQKKPSRQFGSLRRAKRDLNQESQDDQAIIATTSKSSLKIDAARRNASMDVPRRSFGSIFRSNSIRNSIDKKKVTFAADAHSSNSSVESPSTLDGSISRISFDLEKAFKITTPSN